jgi:signal transduction histidine kinase
MAEAGPSAANKDRLLQLGVHEFRTPITVISGYLKMLLNSRTGTLTDSQRDMLQGMEKSTARLSALIAEMNDLSLLEGGGATFNFGSVDFATLVESEIASLPPMPDRDVRVVFRNQAPGAKVHGDPVRLRTALVSLLIAHRRELVTSHELGVWLRRVSRDGAARLQITIGGPDRIAALEEAAATDLTEFEEFRGGIGFTLPIASRIVHAHGGQLWSPAENPKAGAVLFLPEA